MSDGSGTQSYSLVPPALTLAAVGINLTLGAQRAPAFEVPGAVQLAVRFVFIFLWIGLGEEPGWRGFALPRLLSGRSALAAALIVGVIHMVWHLPLYGVEYDAGECLAVGDFGDLFFHRDHLDILAHGREHPMPMLMHASNNTIAFMWRMFEGADQLRLWWLWCALWVLIAAAILLSVGRNLTRQSR